MMFRKKSGPEDLVQIRVGRLGYGQRLILDDGGRSCVPR